MVDKHPEAKGRAHACTCLSLASHLQVFARGRDLPVIFSGEYHS